MQVRLALLIAAAVIFAPYPSGEEYPEPPRGADLAARVLAPTFDEGAMRSATQEVNHQLTSQHATRLNPERAVVGPVSALLVGVALSVVWLLRFERIRVLHRYRYSSKLSRGPPLLQLA